MILVAAGSSSKFEWLGDVEISLLTFDLEVKTTTMAPAQVVRLVAMICRCGSLLAWEAVLEVIGDRELD